MKAGVQGQASPRNNTLNKFLILLITQGRQGLYQAVSPNYLPHNKLQLNYFIVNELTSLQFYTRFYKIIQHIHPGWARFGHKNYCFLRNQKQPNSPLRNINIVEDSGTTLSK